MPMVAQNGGLFPAVNNIVLDSQFRETRPTLDFVILLRSERDKGGESAFSSFPNKLLKNYPDTVL